MILIVKCVYKGCNIRLLFLYKLCLKSVIMECKFCLNLMGYLLIG